MILSDNGLSGPISLWGIVLLFTLFGSTRESNGEVLFDAGSAAIPSSELELWIPAIIAGPVDPGAGPEAVDPEAPSGLSGLCMYAPLGNSFENPDNNMVGWMRQADNNGGTIGLIDMTTWEAKTRLNSNITVIDQSAVGAEFIDGAISDPFPTDTEPPSTPGDGTSTTPTSQQIASGGAINVSWSESEDGP